jgi:hypothetical protein
MQRLPQPRVLGLKLLALNFPVMPLCIQLRQSAALAGNATFHVKERTFGLQSVAYFGVTLSPQRITLGGEGAENFGGRWSVYHFRSHRQLFRLFCGDGHFSRASIIASAMP